MSETATVADALRDLAHEPDWILLDLMLPDGSGTDVIRHVKARKLPSKVCLISGCGPEMLNDARRAGAEHTFTKPLDLDRLMTVLGEA